MAKKKKKLTLSKQIIFTALDITEKGLAKLREREKWVWIPYHKLLTIAGSVRRLYDLLLVLTILGWEKVEIGNDHYVVLRAKHYEYAKEKLEATKKEIIQKRARSR